MSKELKELEYPDAPSGYVTLYNYKEPFMPFRCDITNEGFGYEGVLLFDGETDKVQCHLCGDWFETLGNHTAREHGMGVGEYKKMVGLSKNTALIGEKYRAKLIASGQKRFNNIRPGTKMTEETKKKISDTLKEIRREQQNLTGTCPAQLIDRLKKRAEILGRCPTVKEVSFRETLIKVYGSFSEACRVAGLTPLKSGQTLKKTKYTKDYFVPFVKNFWINNGRLPRFRDGLFKKGVWGSYQKVKKVVEMEVLKGEKVYHRTPVRVNYSKEELIEILKIFIEKNGRNPSVSDCKRGLLPHASRYYYNFGSLKKALELI
jgi:hypothetical protein